MDFLIASHFVEMFQTCHPEHRARPAKRDKRKSKDPENASAAILKAEFFETLRHLNRGYGVALAALDRLETKDRLPERRVFPAGFLQDYRNRTEKLRALANHDVLLLVAGREQQEAERFGRLCGQSAKRNR